MFEDATFESNGMIRTRSLRWMTATFILNGSLLTTLIVIPLVRPEALPRQALAFLLATPPPPASPPPREPAPATHPMRESVDRVIFAPPRMQHRVWASVGPAEGPVGAPLSMEPGEGLAPGGLDAFRARGVPAVVHPEAKGPVRLSSSMVAGLLTEKTMPEYPAIAKAAGVEGVVVLAATIAKSGTIENLRVVSGPVMLQRAALDAVKSWRYRPYVLDGMPVEVETSIYVVFKLGR